MIHCFTRFGLHYSAVTFVVSCRCCGCSSLSFSPMFRPVFTICLPLQTVDSFIDSVADEFEDTIQPAT